MLLIEVVIYALFLPLLLQNVVAYSLFVKNHLAQLQAKAVPRSLWKVRLTQELQCIVTLMAHFL